ncbi:MAG: response regulator [Elusimicrobiota bacterium]
MNATILIADDDPIIVSLLKEYLTGGKYRVLESYDGATALTLAREQKPHLIIMDLNMPLLNGLQALEAMRAQPETKEIPIVFLSGNSSRQLSATLRNEQGVALLEKPIDLNQLEFLLSKLLGPSSPGAHGRV